ncbi:MAG: undecaprenyldiphospho-muramoylpentapeptide beta-N-acetylglucosaminyltransferase [Acidobacteriota bacterium]|nr:undecaprenyldiphospho-muramoylpentapeptide beta-N-acetylglucosaminyltransferase [Acidobacteriota bacterium]
MKIILAGGGTGGHVIPALAVANELRAAGHKVAFVGTTRGIETRLVPQAGYPLYLVNVGALNRVSLMTRLRTMLRLPISILSAARVLLGFGTHVVIGVGGYAAGPATMAAVLLRIPVVLFEPNVVPGFANRKVARFAANAGVQFEQAGKWFPRHEVTGIPVRPAFFNLPPRKSPAPSLLAFGGSQGARALNRILCESAAALLQRVPGLRIVHQTGPREFEEVKAAYAASKIPVEVSAFIDDMAQSFADADLIVCRSGASTVAEIAAAGKCALFVPFPGAADDHQLRNAELLASQGAALLIPENDLTPARFVEEVAALLASPGRMAQMGSRSRQLAHPDAAAHLARMAIAAANR